MTDPDLSQRAARPWIEIRRQLGVGHYRSYAMIHRKPLRVWIYGHWVIGRVR
jgi:hypothetical protein